MDINSQHQNLLGNQISPKSEDAAILNPKRPSKYKNPLIWAKFGFQVEFDVAN
jgi:hypothetical protein